MNENTNVATLLRDLGDDSGRPLPTDGRGILAIGKRTKRRRRVAMVAGAAALCTALAVAVPTIGVLGTPPVATATAATYLRDVAGRVPMAPAREGTYWKVAYEATSWTPGGDPSTPIRVTMWDSRDAWFTQLNDEKIEAGVGREFHVEGDVSFSWDELSALPSEPSALREALRREIDEDAEEWAHHGSIRKPRIVLNQITLGLLVLPVRPEVRRSVFLLASEMAGARLMGPATDSRGRAGTAIELQEDRVTMRYIVSDDGDLLQLNVMLPSEGDMSEEEIAEYGNVSSQVTFLSQGWVDEVK